MLSLDLNEEQSAVQSTVREFAKAHLRPKLRQIEKTGASDELKAKFDELGLFGADWPEAAGGQNLGALARVIIEEELAFGDVGAALALDRGGAAANFLLAVNTPAAHTALKSLVEGKGHAALAAAEAGKAQDDFRATAVLQRADSGAQRAGFVVDASRSSQGSPAAGEARAKQSGGGWVLNGKKAFVLGGGDASLHVVLAQVEAGRGLSGAGAFLFEGSNAGLRAGRTTTTLGLNAVPVREVVIEGLKLPESARLDGPGSLPQVLRRYYDRVAVITSARAVGLASASYEYARAYADERVAFGKPIGHFQAIAFLISDMATQVDAARLSVWKAAWSQEKDSGVSVAAAAAQAQCLEAAFFCANSAVQVLGGAGYVQDHPVEKWMRDSKTLALYGQHAQASHAVLSAAALGRPLDGADLFPLPSLHASLS